MIWKRLHPEFYGGLPFAPGDEQSSSLLKSEEYPSPPSALIQDSNQTQMPHVDAKITSIQAEEKPSALYNDDKSTRECLIPKKRYCVQSYLEQSTISTDQYPELPPLGESDYSETDMSAAMILANGFDRDCINSDYSPVIEEV